MFIQELFQVWWSQIDDFTTLSLSALLDRANTLAFAFASTIC